MCGVDVWVFFFVFCLSADSCEGESDAWICQGRKVRMCLHVCVRGSLVVVHTEMCGVGAWVFLCFFSRHSSADS